MYSTIKMGTSCQLIGWEIAGNMLPFTLEVMSSQSHLLYVDFPKEGWISFGEAMTTLCGTLGGMVPNGPPPALEDMEEC